MADYTAAHLLPALADLPISFITKGSDVGACVDHLHIASKRGVGRAIVKTAKAALTHVATPKPNVTTLLAATALVFLTVIAHELIIDIQTPPSTLLGCHTIGAMVLTTAVVFISWYGEGGPAWSFARLTAPLGTPNGPRGWPILGSWSLMQGANMHRDLAEQAWGSASTRKLMALSVGATRIVVTSDPNVAKHLLQSPEFGDRPLKQAAHLLGFARAIGFAPQGPYWRHLRKLAASHMFSHKQIVAHRTALQRETSRMIGAMMDEVEGARGGRAGLGVRPYLQRAAVNNVTGAVLGRWFRFGSSCLEAEALEGLIREGFELLGAFNWADHVPVLWMLPFLPFESRCRRLSKRVEELLQPIVDERRGRRQSRDCSAFVDVLLSLEGDQKLADEDMISVLWEMVFRGTDTIAVLTEWALAEVILNPEIQRNIHKELDAVVGHNRPVEQKDIDQLPYLQAVVKETLRRHPPGPLLSWARLASNDTQVAGYHVPQGTNAMVNMWAITHDANVWPNPYAFDPSRFMRCEGGVEMDVLGTDLRLAPFGSGRRVCPGRTLGVATAQLWLARLLHHFSWSQDPSCPIELTENLKLSCEMASPLHACAVVRIPSCELTLHPGSIL